MFSRVRNPRRTASCRLAVAPLFSCFVMRSSPAAFRRANSLSKPEISSDLKAKVDGSGATSEHSAMRPLA